MASLLRDRAPEPRSRYLARLVDALSDAFVVLTALAAGVGVLAARTGLRPLASAGGARVVLAALVIVAGLLLVGAARDRARPGVGLLPALPGLVLLAYAVAVRLLSPGARAEWFLGGDHVRHLLFVADERAVGNLDYAEQPYPRAWHTVITTIWSATGARLDGAGLRSLVDLMSTATWCLPALLSLATGSLTVAVARRYGVDLAPARMAGLGAAAAVLLPSFLANYQALGFENSYVGAIVLAVVARETLVTDERHRTRSVLIILAGLVVCAHSWQLLLPPAGVALLYVAWPVVRRGRGRTRVLLGAASGLGLLVALPALLAVFVVIGVQHATDSQVVAPVPMIFLSAGVASAFLVVWRRRRDGALVTFLLIVLLPAVTVGWLVARVGVAWTDYYPSKLLWHSAVLGLSPLAVLLVRAWTVLGQRAESVVRRTVRGAGAVVAALSLLYALVSPMAAFVGAWSSVRGPVVLDAITSRGAGEAQVVWLGTVGDDTIGRILLDFYRVPDSYRTPQSPLDLARECALLRVASTPTVLTDRPVHEVVARYACVSALDVVMAQPDG